MKLLPMNDAGMVFDEFPVKNIVVWILFCRFKLNEKFAESTTNYVISVGEKKWLFSFYMYKENITPPKKSEKISVIEIVIMQW